MAKRRTSRAWAGLAAAVTAAAFATGCGDDSTASDGPVDARAVAQVLADLEAASRAGDGRRICRDIFTPKLAQSVSTAAPSGSCATEVKDKLFAPDAEIRIDAVEVPDAVNAKATVTERNGNTSTVFLVKSSDRWMIRGIVPA